MHEGPCADAEDGEKPGLPSLRHASPDDLEGIRTRQKVEGDPGHQKKSEIVRPKHCRLPLFMLSHVRQPMFVEARTAGRPASSSGDRWVINATKLKSGCACESLSGSI